MTLTELQQINALKEENSKLKRENESLRTRHCAALYAIEQIRLRAMAIVELYGARV